jgi:predicted RecB family nuclease
MAEAPTRARSTLLAHHLYDFADCEHRVALDATLDRSLRTPPDPATELLLEHGRRFEREIVDPLGYPAVEIDDADWDRAAARTLDLMRSGVPGIDQGVLIGPGRLARPDLLERVDGPSAFGGFYYVPGDVKSALSPRTDAALQVGFAALLLERAQGLRPSTGFLVLGDGRREIVDLDAIRTTVDDAVARAEAVSLGSAETVPFFGPSCAHCRWRGTCLPRLESERDVSFVAGLTRTRHRVLRRYGVSTIDELAAANLGALVAAGVPSDGLERAQMQARSLLEGGVLRRRAVPVPRGVRRELFAFVEADPLDHGAPFLVAWGEGAAGGGGVESYRVHVVSTDDERRSAALSLLEILESQAVAREPVYSFGGRTLRSIESLCDGVGVSPARTGDLLGRVVDLAPWVRRAGILPVFRYAFAEVAALARGTPRPRLDDGDDALFVLHAALSAAPDPGVVRGRLESAGVDALRSLAAIRAWVASGETGSRRS